MKPWRLPSGIQSGIPMLLADDWTAEQALAVVELLDDLREQIWRQYEIPLHELLRSRQLPSDDLFSGSDEPF